MLLTLLQSSENIFRHTFGIINIKTGNGYIKGLVAYEGKTGWIVHAERTAAGYAGAEHFYFVLRVLFETFKYNEINVPCHTIQLRKRRLCIDRLHERNFTRTDKDHGFSTCLLKAP